jgi:hypothetical protein
MGHRRWQECRHNKEAEHQQGKTPEPGYGYFVCFHFDPPLLFQGLPPRPKRHRSRWICLRFNALFRGFARCEFGKGNAERRASIYIDLST